MKKDSGFTLIEAMIVISIVGLLISAFGYSYQVYMPQYRLNSSIRELQSALHQAKLTSVKRRVPVTVSFDIVNDVFLIFADINANGGLDPADTVLKRFATPSGVDLYAAVPAFFRFNPRGFPIGGVGDCYIRSRITNEAGNIVDDYRGVRLSLAGSSRIIKSEDGVTWH